MGTKNYPGCQNLAFFYRFGAYPPSNMPIGTKIAINEDQDLTGSNRIKHLLRLLAISNYQLLNC